MVEEFSSEGMMDMYLFENKQLLQYLEALLLEKKDLNQFDMDDVNEIFRVMHTIKGSSGIMMHENITKVSHKMEDIFYYIRETGTENAPHQELVTIIFDVSDFISAELDKVADGAEADGECSELMDTMKNFIKKLKDEHEMSETVPENQHEEVSHFYIAPVSTEASRFYKIKLYFRPDSEMVNIRAYNCVYALKEVAEDLLYDPEDILSNEKSSEEILLKGFSLLLQTQSEPDYVRNLIDNCPDISEIVMTECKASDFLQDFEPAPVAEMIMDLDSDVETIERRAREKEEAKTKEKTKAKPKEKTKEEPQPGDYVISSKAPGKKPKLAKQLRKEKQEKQSFISVNVSKMDALMDLIGEIVIAESVVLQNPDLQVPGLNLSNFQKAVGQLTKFTTELQDIIMSMRMMPLANTFQKMNRIVFDVSRQLKKEIDFEIIGEETEVDKKIIENISDPLMHLVRNSVDHGIESAEERIAAGKNPKGKITIEAKNEGGKVFVIVRDDGKGLDATQIYSKAKENELIEDGKSKSDFTEKEIFQFISLPGFSTKEKVTEYSGRGVGMDVVVKNIQKIGGRLEIESEKGKGSAMILKIPLTLAIIQGIVMRVGTATFVVENSSVTEFLSVTQENLVREPDGAEFVVIREEYYPIIRLEETFHIERNSRNNEKWVMVVLEQDGKKAGIFVDQLIGQQEIVVKPIPTYITKVNGISGCTQLGDGSIALILDVGGLIT